jgi:patatin-like phospholipase/acyl hydrolase
MGNRFQILALDGGGYKGMFAAALLERLEADLGISLVDHFDLITGTSTGGIIALGLGAGLRPSEITSFYVEHGDDIFPGRLRRPTRRVFASKFSPAPLRHALEQVLGERTLGESRVPLVIPSYDLTNDDVYVFRTPHSPRLRRDRHELMVEVALATSAAPTYLPAHEMRGLRLIDGGVWANNPTMVGLVEAISSFGCAVADIGVFSLGTTTDTAYRRPRLDRGGLLAWGREAFDIVLRGQNLAARNTATLMLGAANVLRVDPAVPAKVLRLDGVDPQQLRGRAEHVSRHICPDFEKRFAQHRAPPYTPEPMQGDADV